MLGWGQCWCPLTILRERLFRITNKKKQKPKNIGVLKGLNRTQEVQGSRAMPFKGLAVHWGVNCLGVQWVYSDHIQRAFSSRSFKSKCVKGARGGICINGISWGLRDWGALKSEEKRNHHPHPETQKVSQWSQVAPVLGFCQNDVHHWSPSLSYSFRLSLAIFYKDMEINFSLVEVLEGSCFWRDHIHLCQSHPLSMGLRDPVWK